jgi:lysophospholipase L1-like esterase
MKRFILSVAAVFSLLWPLAADAQDDPANKAKYREQNISVMKSGKVDGRVVFMGNSITEFWNLSDPRFFGNKPYINRGISGQTTPQMLMRFKEDVLDLKPDAVVILAGINDIAENSGPIPLHQTASNIFSMVEQAKAHGIRPVMCSVLPAKDFPWRPGLNPATKVVKLNNMLREYARANKITFVEYYNKMVDKDLGLNSKYSGDGVHPNDAGYKVMARILSKQL